MLLKRKWNKISLLPYIQPHKLDLVNRCRKKKKNFAKKSLTHPWDPSIGMISTWRPHSAELPWTSFWTFGWLLYHLSWVQYSCMFSLQPLKFKFTTIYNYCIPYVILIHLLMQPCGFVWTKKCQLKMLLFLYYLVYVYSL